jgi:hypothetical protein
MIKQGTISDTPINQESIPFAQGLLASSLTRPLLKCIKEGIPLKALIMFHLHAT